MNTNSKDETEERYKRHVLGNYGLPPLTLARGRGARVWDAQGKAYLDFVSGIAVTSLGHCHPALVRAVREQAETLVHASNLFRNEPQGRLASRLDALAGGGGKVFFCNSGAEANETLLKLSRLYGRAQSGEEGRQYRVVCAENAFHGRTFAGMSATPQEKIQAGFRPLLEGFAFAKLNDLASFEAAIDERAAAVLVETIQGEGGVFPAEPDFLQGLRRLCDEREVLLLIDEVQCGIGRSGAFFAFEQAGVRPDAIGMAKGLGGGLPIGAVWIDDRHAGLFRPGSHGTTFGGGPVVCAAALAVLDAIESEGLLENARRQGARLMERLAALRRAYPDYVEAVRGRGLMVGLSLVEEPAALAADLRERGLLAPPAGNRVLRLLPPLDVDEAAVDEALSLLEAGLRARRAAMAAAADS